MRQEESQGSAIRSFKTFMHRKSETSKSNIAGSGDSKVSSSSQLLSPSGSTTATTLSESNSLPPKELLSDPVLLAKTTQELAEAERRQGSTSFLQRLRWSLIEKNKFEKAIKELRRSNSNLHHLVPLRENNASVTLLKERRSDNVTESKDTQEFVKRLHKAVSSVNAPNSTNRLTFGMKLVNNHETTRELWDNQGLAFRDGSSVFQLQAQKLGNEGQSSLLLVDAFLQGDPTITDDAEKSSNPISSMYESILPLSDSGDENFKLLGHIPLEKREEGCCLFYQDISASWVSKSTLERDLHNQDLSSSNLRTQHITLAALAALPYAQCPKEKFATPHPRPQNYHFFDQEGEQDSTDEQPVPYVSFGLGSQAPRASTRNAGRFVPVGESLNIPGIELGLLLFQIGSWTPLEYMSGHKALEKMKAKALASLDEVTSHSGLAYARIVEACLLLSKEDYEADLYQEVVARLQELDRSLK